MVLWGPTPASKFSGFLPTRLPNIINGWVVTILTLAVNIRNATLILYPGSDDDDDC